MSASIRNISYSFFMPASEHSSASLDGHPAVNRRRRPLSRLLLVSPYYLLDLERAQSTRRPFRDFFSSVSSDGTWVNCALGWCTLYCMKRIREQRLQWRQLIDLM